MSDWITWDNECEKMRSTYTIPARLKNKVCPYCGGQHIYPDYILDETTSNRFYWYCSKCGASEETLYPDWDSALENWSNNNE